ncbi:MAG: Abi family protein [Coriobacteriales bacterium]|nr:Abi family protein [Coriobacteriales bacterium]
MIKEYLDVSRQMELLEQRGLSCDDHSKQILLREGYYAVVNGYGKFFLDQVASERAHEDRYLPQATFADVYTLFLFDRALRMLTFSQLTSVEGMLRSLVSTAFLEVHDGPEDYLDPTCYTQPSHYLLGERNYDRNLRLTINTLSRYAHDHEDDERGHDDVRLAHYRANYDSVPLWVVFSDFSFGNLFHFLALMRQEEQAVVCKKLAYAIGSAAGTQDSLSRKTLINDVDLQVDVRNICAHGERLFDARMGYKATQDYADFVGMLGRYLPSEDARGFAQSLLELLDKAQDASSLVQDVLAQTHIREATQRL